MGPITVFRAKKILTMEPALPEATAVAVADGRIVAVGSPDSISAWTTGRHVTVDDSFADHFLVPGFIDPHVHPSLPAVLTQFPFIAPDDWTLPAGYFPGARTHDAYISRLLELVGRHGDEDVPFITWGYHSLWHGDIYRPLLNELFGEQPVVLWHRSFHELIANDAALEWAGVSAADVAEHPEVDWDRGHFWENGAFALIGKLAGIAFEPAAFRQGLETFLEMLHLGGVTTCLDMGIGIFGDPPGEFGQVRAAVEDTDAPNRVILTPIITDFLARGVDPTDAVTVVEEWRRDNTDRVLIDRRFKLMIDGAIFSGLSQYGFPGYLDGHDGVWMAPPETIRQWAEVFWRAGYQLHAHTNGDLSADLFIDILRHLQSVHPRFDHRMTLEHFAFTTEQQNRQLGALGALVSANPYYLYILGDAYSDEMLGPERGSQMVRLGSLERHGTPFALHSDCPMAPLSPLTLAWVAANRVTIDGSILCPEERTSLDAALRAITIDAAWIMGWENEIGSIRAGKRADLTVLDADPYDVGAEGLRDIGVLGTVFGGRPAPISGR